MSNARKPTDVKGLRTALVWEVLLSSPLTRTWGSMAREVESRMRPQEKGTVLA